MSTINFKAIGLLEGQNQNTTAHLLIPRLEPTRGPKKKIFNQIHLLQKTNKKPDN